MVNKKKGGLVGAAITAGVLAGLAMPHSASALPSPDVRAESTYKVTIESSPKSIAMGFKRMKNCKRAVKVRVAGPALSATESMTIRLEMKVLNGPQQSADPHFTYDVRPGRVTTVLPSDDGVDICSFVAGKLGPKGKYKIALIATAVVRAGSIAVDGGSGKAKLVANYSGYWG